MYSSTTYLIVCTTRHSIRSGVSAGPPCGQSLITGRPISELVDVLRTEVTCKGISNDICVSQIANFSLQEYVSALPSYCDRYHNQTQREALSDIPNQEKRPQSTTAPSFIPMQTTSKSSLLHVPISDNSLVANSQHNQQLVAGLSIPSATFKNCFYMAEPSNTAVRDRVFIE